MSDELPPNAHPVCFSVSVLVSTQGFTMRCSYLTCDITAAQLFFSPPWFLFLWNEERLVLWIWWWWWEQPRRAFAEGLHCHIHRLHAAAVTVTSTKRGRHWNKCPRVKIRFIQVSLQCCCSSCDIHPSHPHCRQENTERLCSVFQKRKPDAEGETLYHLKREPLNKTASCTKAWEGHGCLNSGT